MKTRSTHILGPKTRLVATRRGRLVLDILGGVVVGGVVGLLAAGFVVAFAGC